MIKINLNKTKTSVTDMNLENTQAMFEDDDNQQDFMTKLTEVFSKAEDLDSETFIKAILKLCLLGALPLGLKVYEIQQIDQINTRIETKQKQLEKVNSDISQIKIKTENIKSFEQQAAEYESKKKFLKQLTSDRLEIPRFLDNIQNNIPNTVWLKKIHVSLPDVRETVGQSSSRKNILIAGETINEENVFSFSKNLENINGVSAVQVDTQDYKTKNIERVKFDIKARLSWD